MRKIKLVICTFIAFFAGMAPCYSQSDDAVIENAINTINALMPMPMGSLGELTSAYLERRNVVLIAEVNEDFLNIEKLQENPEIMHESMVSFMKNTSNPNVILLLSVVKESDKGLKYVYIGKKSKKSVSVVLTNREIREALDAPAGNKNVMDVIESQIRLTNAQLPMYTGGGMTIMKLALEGNYLAYTYECDENIVSIDRLNDNRVELKRLLINELTTSTDSMIKMLVEMCKEADLGIIYRYVGDTSGKDCTVYLNNSEL